MSRKGASNPPRRPTPASAAASGGGRGETPRGRRAARCTGSASQVATSPTERSQPRGSAATRTSPSRPTRMRRVHLTPLRTFRWELGAYRAPLCCPSRVKSIQYNAYTRNILYWNVLYYVHNEWNHNRNGNNWTTCNWRGAFSFFYKRMKYFNIILLYSILYIEYKNSIVIKI